MMKKLTALIALVFTWNVAHSQAFPLFEPANGILKGDTSTYVTTAAAAADVYGLWSSCTSSKFLRGDGTCALVALASNVSGTLPVANGGTGAATLSGPLKGNGTSAFTAAAAADIYGLWTSCTASKFLQGDGACAQVALASEVSGTLPVANGGTGAGTLTGPLKGNGTSAFSAAVSSDVYGLWSGSCSASTYLRGDGACSAVAGATGGTVTSVDMTVPGILTVSGNPITTSGTLAVGATGTSGGIPYFSSASALASSGALTNHAIVLGGGAGATPTALGSLGTSTTLLHGAAAGNPSFSAVDLANDVTGNLPVGNLNSGTSADNTHFWRGDGTWAVPAGTATGTVTSVALTVPGILSISGSPVTTSGTLAIGATGTSGGIPYFSSASALASSGALTQHALVVGGGAGATPTVVGSLGTSHQVLHGAAAGDPTWSAVDLASSDVTGNLAVTNLNSGTNADSSHYWRGDGTWQTISAGTSAIDVQTFTSTTPGTWTKPSGSPLVTEIIMVGAGGGGGGGNKDNGFNASGGCGGAGGEFIDIKVATASLSSPITVTPGTGGTGGTGQSTNEGTANDGNNGTATTFGSVFTANYGGAGHGGQTLNGQCSGGVGGGLTNGYKYDGSNPPTGAGNGGTTGGTAGGDGTFGGGGGGGNSSGTAGKAGGNSERGAAGGGSGGGMLHSGPTGQASAAGGTTIMAAGGASASAGTSGTGGTGGDGVAPSGGGYGPCSGAGGGGGSNTGSGGPGGAGCRGSGGGGGGSTSTGTKGGDGGKGGDGYVVVITYY